jgi:hypothetical protein
LIISPVKGRQTDRHTDKQTNRQTDREERQEREGRERGERGVYNLDHLFGHLPGRIDQHIIHMPTA